jgi:selenide,water dikinase
MWRHSIDVLHFVKHTARHASTAGADVMDVPQVRLTSLAHGGGCGCKLAPSVLQQLLAGHPTTNPYKQLLVGIETGDDAAVWKLDDGTCVISTTDFFMPMVDDPFDFGRIAATNAISDVYAMGGTPIMALAILGMPVDKIAPEMVRMILEGGRSICDSAGIPVAGGHSIDCPEPVYGLAVTGLCKAEEVRRNADAKPGDAVILTKPLGVGIYSAAIKKAVLPQGGYTDMIATTTLLNRVGAKLAKDKAVHAMTDVTGFGVLGHGLEMARGAGATLVVDMKSLPFLPEAALLAQQGCVTGASHRNWASYGESVRLPSACADWQRHLLTDPQTSGGLLIACAPERAETLVRDIVADGYPSARVIGRIEAGPPAIRVEA